MAGEGIGNGRVRGERGREEKGNQGKGRGEETTGRRTPKVGSHPMFEILKNTVLATESVGVVYSRQRLTSVSDRSRNS